MQLEVFDEEQRGSAVGSVPINQNLKSVGQSASLLVSWSVGHSSTADIHVIFTHLVFC